MSAQRTISVVLVAMNDERYIADTIESVLNQSYPALELHVQHGSASTDSTLDVVKQYPVQWVSEPDTGVPDAFNRGFRATHGEMMIFLGADDPLLPGSIQTLVDTMTDHPDAGFTYGDVEYIDAYGKSFYRLKGRPFALDDLFWFNHVPTQSVMMRRAALVEVGLYRTGIINADWDLWLRLGARYPSVYIPKLLGCYRVHDGSTSLNNLRHMAWSTCWVADTLLSDPVIVSRLRRGVSRAFAGSYLTATLLSVLAGEKPKAWNLYAQAIRRYPPALLTRRGIMAFLALLLGPQVYARLRSRGRRPG